MHKIHKLQQLINVKRGVVNKNITDAPPTNAF